MYPSVLTRSLIAALGAAVMFGANSAFAFESKAFDAAGFKAAQAAGKPSVIHVTAPWCPTCTAQDKIIQGLASKPEYAAVTVYKVDFDSQKDVLAKFKANSQSTLIAFNGATETSRNVGGTSTAAVGGVFAASVKK
jgi:thioredoxin 1